MRKHEEIQTMIALNDKVHHRKFLLIVLFIVLSITLQFAGVDLKIYTDPAELKLNAIRKHNVYVFVRNLSSTEVSDIQLFCLDFPGLDIKTAPQTISALPPNGMGVWTLFLSPKETVHLSGMVHIGINCLAKVGTGSQKTPYTFYENFRINSQKETSTENSIEIKAEPPEEILLERKSYRLNIIIRHWFPYPVEITELSPIGPDFLKFLVLKSIKGEKLEPGITYTFPIQLKLGNKFTPGTHQSGFNLEFKWQELGSEIKGNRVVSFKIKTGILGESEILTALSIPSFLLLPGIIFLIVISWLRRHFYPKEAEYKRIAETDKSILFFELKSPVFWIAAITISILIAALYPQITGLFGEYRDYTINYGYTDVLLVWFSSIALAVIGYFLIGFALYKWYLCKREFRVEDTPYTALTKIVRKRIPLFLKSITIELNGRSQNLYLLDKTTEGKTPVWGAPAIQLKWLTDNHEFRNNAQKMMVRQGDPLLLVETLKEGKKNRQLELKWKDDSHLILIEERITKGYNDEETPLIHTDYKE